jgi:hypothetical protein
MTEHVCVDCRALPDLPADAPKPVGSRIRAGFRPPKPLATKGGPRSQRCTIHARAHKHAQQVASRISGKSRKFRLTPEVLWALWALQGYQCPCGAKHDEDEIPPGLHLDHDHELAAEHDHPDDEGCEDCVLGYLCGSCNREIVGRLTGRRRGDRAAGRAGAAAALANLAAFLTDPPMARLRRTLTEVPA